MRLRAIRINNFGCIDGEGCEVEIDRIVVLIGPDNVGKSTILDAYRPLPALVQRNRSEIQGVGASSRVRGSSIENWHPECSRFLTRMIPSCCFMIP
jgi:predicted ATPase